MAIFSEAFWKNEIARMGLPEMPLQAVTKQKENPIYCEPKKYKELQKSFLKKVGFNHEEMQNLWRISLTREGIVQVREGKLPENLNIIFKVPLDYGGKEEIENMLLIQTHPFTDILFRFLRSQCRKHHETEKEKSALYGY
ncbi:MAG: hypothetical protein ACTSXV_01265, partial [Alphaproteobacteria bacterium]